MNAVEIEEAVSKLATAPFDPGSFPFAFLEAFGNKPTTIKRLKSKTSSSNQSDLPGGVLQRNNIHLMVCAEGEVGATLAALRESGATARQKVKFILATDGKDFEAENLVDGDVIVCEYPNFADHFDFFLPLAGITTVKQIRENAFDIKATGRLNRLYVELLKDNPDWESRQEDFNHFMARLIFCFFAEDTNIFHGEGLFTQTVAQMSDGSNTHEVLAELFRAMATPLREREALGIRNWANGFPYVNGGLFGFHPLISSREEGEERLFNPHPLTPSPKEGEGGQEESLTPLSPSGRGAGGEGQEQAYWEIPPALKQKMTEVARQFRKDPTPSEAILWQALRGRKLEGRKFRRQQPIGAFVVDFFCGTERLIVEVDGGIHESQKEADRQRQELLESLGLRLVRISSELVETSLDQVLLLIRQAFFPHPLTPSPTLGEGGQEESLTPLSLSGRGAGGEGVPRFSKVARSYLLHIGNLDWKQINPDIFGSMIQAIAQEEERGALGMHYTSVPNILKVLNPLFLDDLRAQLESAGDNARKLLNLRQRLSKIRVFDPACGSGNFLVIAYKEMRAIEATINQRRGEADRRSKIPLTNFRGIEIRHFAVEVARLALIIAEYQCDVLYRGPKLALAEFLPLKSENWITCGNALRLDWLSLCPPTGTGVKLVAEDLFSTPLEQTEIDFANEGGETYLCGNPPYQGSVNQTSEQKEDMRQVFASIFKNYKDLDYVAAFMLQAARFNRITSSSNAFVTTNSITQGEQVALLWPLIYGQDNHIHFAHTSFQWSNLASNKAAVTCVIVGLTTAQTQKKILFSGDVVYEVVSISPYLAPGTEIIVEKRSSSIHSLTRMDYGNKPTDGGNLILSKTEYQDFITHYPELKSLIREYIGSRDFIHSIRRYCFWIEAETLELALNNPEIKDRLERVRALRSESRGKQANQHAKAPHRFVFCPHTDNLGIVIPRHVSENRAFLTVGLVKGDSHVIADSASAIYDANLVDFAVLSSHLHLVWIATVCGKLKTDFRYSNTLGWNTFPVPTLTDRNKADLTRCAEDILLAREQYFPAAIADMYDPDRMDSEFPLVREAHDRNDEVLERIYIGRRFKNDTERLEKLFELYTKMTNQKAPAKKSTKRK